MRRLIEDYKENSALICNVHQLGNNDSLPEKKTRDIETLNTCLFYLIFKWMSMIQEHRLRLNAALE